MRGGGRHRLVGLHLLGLLGVVGGFPVASNVMRLEAVRVYASFAFGALIGRQGALDGGMALGTFTGGHQIDAPRPRFGRALIKGALW